MEALREVFERTFQRSPQVMGRAPGRVNLLGEHVDYNGGVVLPAAIDRQVRLQAAARPDGITSLYALDLGERVEFSLSNLKAKIDVNGSPLPVWARYPAGVAWALSEAGLQIDGIEAVFTSDIPIGAGLSSSAAVEVMFAVVWQALAGWQLERLELAKICQRAENQYVGVSSGLMDQFASACGVKDHALIFDTRSLEWEPISLPDGILLVIADSGVRRTLLGSAYNERRAACEAAVECLRQYLPNIQTLRDVTPTEFAAYSPMLPEIPRRRAEHVVKEIHRVETAITALHRKDRQALGALLFAGHASLKNLYEVSTPELDTLVELARTLPGCLGARLTGAGFGGCTINLVESSQSAAFIEGLQEGYVRATGLQAKVYACRASDGAKAAKGDEYAAIDRF